MRDWREHAQEAQMDAAGPPTTDAYGGLGQVPRGVRMAREGSALQQGGPQSVSPFVYLSEAHSAVHSLLNRVSILADRLVGPQPENASQEKVNKLAVEGCLGGLRQASVEITDAVSTMNRLLSAIERELP